MSYTWLKKRGKVWHLFYAKGLGKKPHSLNTSDKSLALEVQRRTESAIWGGEHGIKRKDVERIRYSDLLHRFKETKEAAGLNPKTITNYIKTLNQFGLYLQSDVFVDTIRPEHAEGFIAYRRKCPKRYGEGTLAAKSIRNEAFNLNNLFAWAVERDLMLESPMKKVQMPRRVRYDAPRALAPGEYLQLKAAVISPTKDKRVQRAREIFSDIIDLYTLTGIRRSEGLTVTSENFDLERGIATFAQHKQGTHKTLPISPDLAEVVKRMIQRVGVGKPLVQLHASRLTDNFRKARIRAGLPESITFHSLRHTFASWLAALGTDFRTLQALIGHQSPEATQLYTHTFDPNKRSAIEKLVLPRRAAS